MADPLPLASINHLSHEVADVERSSAFYREVLGFRTIGRPNFDFPGAWLYGYGVQLHLIQGNPPARSVAVSPRADHVAFHTTDPPVVEKRLQEHHINYLRNMQGPTGLVQIFFHDPDGNHIEIAEYPAHPDVRG